MTGEAGKDETRGVYSQVDTDKTDQRVHYQVSHVSNTGNHCGCVC